MTSKPPSPRTSPSPVTGIIAAAADMISPSIESRSSSTTRLTGRRLRCCAMAARAATRRERRAATRAGLLLAAESVIAERGVDAATLGEIAKAANVTKGALYHHFESKDELLLALLDSRFQEHLEVTKRILASGTSSPGARFVEEVPF